jgi:transposase
MHHAIGTERNQIQMFCPEQFIESDNFVRVIDAFVDAIDLNSFGFRHVITGEEGRPPYHPAILLKLYIYGYRYGIRSSRKLERQAKINLELRWLLCEQTPSNRTIAYFRKEYSEAFRNVFRKFVFLLKQAQLIEGETIAIDSFKVRGQNSLKNNFNDKKISSHKEYINNKISEYEQALDNSDNEEEKAELEHKIERQTIRKAKYESIEKQLDNSNQEQISLTDPDSRAVILHRNIVQVGYNIQASVDAKNKLITYFDTGDVNDTRALAPVAINTKSVLGLDGMNVLADKGYHTGDQLQRCAFANIITYVSPKAPSTKDIGLYPITSFNYNPESDTYTCPDGEVLATNNVWYRHSSEGKTPAFRFKRYLSSKCSFCKQRSLCTNSGRNGRAIDRSEYADIIAQNATRVNESPSYYRLRQQIAEHPWGTLKRQWAFDYVLMKGKRQVLGEVSLAFICYNLMRSVNIITPRKFIELLIIRSFLPKTALNKIFSPPIYSNFLKKYKIAS